MPLAPDAEGAVAILIDMTVPDGSSPATPPHGVGGCKQVLELLHLSFGRRPEHKMPMVPHDLVRRNSDVGTVLCPGHKTEKLFVISRTLEKNPFVVAPIHDVMN